MSQRNSIKYNGSGYYDPTAYEALKEADRLDQRIGMAYKIIKTTLDLAGLEIEGRLILREKETDDNIRGGIL